MVKLMDYFVCCMVQEEPDQTLLPLLLWSLFPWKNQMIIKNLFSPHCMTNKLHMLRGSCTFQINVGLMHFCNCTFLVALLSVLYLEAR